MFNEFLTRPVTESGFNSLKLKKETSNEYIYANGKDFVTLTSNNPYPNNSITKSSEKINLNISNSNTGVSNVGIVTAKDLVDVAQNIKINISGVKRIGFIWDATLGASNVTTFIALGTSTTMSFINNANDYVSVYSRTSTFTKRYEYLTLPSLTTQTGYPYFYLWFVLEDDTNLGGQTSNSNLYELFLEY